MKNELSMPNPLPVGGVPSQMINSQNLLTMVNDARKKCGEPAIRNNKLIEKIEDELEGETYTKSVGRKNGADIDIITMSIKQAMRVAARESKAVRRSLVDKLEEMQSPPPADAMRMLSDPATLRGLLMNYSEDN